MLGAEDPLGHRQQRGELVPGSSRVPRPPGPPRRGSRVSLVLLLGWMMAATSSAETPCRVRVRIARLPVGVVPAVV